MKMVPFKSLSLTKSFRYGQAIADIASTVLEGKLKIEGNEAIKSVVGMEKVDRSDPYTRLFRTNAALLVAAVEEIQNGTAVSIEIDVKDFVKLMESALALHGKEAKGVKHDKILPYQTWDELVLEAKHDPELTRVSKLIADGNAKRYVEILEHHENAEKPHVTFTTAHKSKGREFSQVMIEGDFKSCYGEDGWQGLAEEEQNLLYVAVTRAINVLDYNQTVVEYLGKAQEESQGYNAAEYMPEPDFKAFIGSELRAQQRLVRDCIHA
jgi:superfamily I DNA/RNA helicase